MSVEIKPKKSERDLPKEPKKLLSYTSLIEHSSKFGHLRKQCQIAVKLSLTGITNLVVNYEDPHLIECFLRSCWDKSSLYKESYDIDAVKLQDGVPGAGNACAFLDKTIFGNPEENKSAMSEFGPSYLKDNIGNRIRESNGFVNRAEALSSRADDNLLIIRNLDYSLDFCQEKPGVVDPRSLWIFDNFRNPCVKRSCQILLVTNERIKFPFKVRTLELGSVDKTEANNIIFNYIKLFKRNKYTVEFSESQRQQIIRKLSGLTYTEAGDVMGEAMSQETRNKDDPNSRKIDTAKVLSTLREKVNLRFMEDAHGLTHLKPRPWEDYITPETSNFTFDVKKIMRDFREVTSLQKDQTALIEKKQDDTVIQNDIDAVCSRMPHVIILTGRGGVGKSAFPIHFAGLLGFDVWDFNVNASHSKWIGEGSERMREALKRISQASHVVVRMDEYDRAMGSTDGGGAGMHEAHKQVESEFMNWLQNSQEDNLFVKNHIFIVMTTNHKENITGPLLRSGRADLVIDIADFDASSLKETFLSAPRRMNHRGIQCIGFTTNQLEAAVTSLDLDRISDIAAMKGFTVRDVDCMLQEMAAHKYYKAKGDFGIEWTTDNFVKVMENSRGSAKEENTCELKIGDREMFDSSEDLEDDPQQVFPFAAETKSEDKFTIINPKGFE